MLDRIDAPTRKLALCVIIALNPNGRVMMTRDMELIRKILLQIQSRKDTSLESIELEGYDPRVVARHVEMLLKECYLEGKSIESGTDDSVYITVSDLSWSGHDFIAALENESVWTKLKQSLSPNELATLPLNIVKSVGLKVLEAYIMHKTGLSDT